MDGPLNLKAAVKSQCKFIPLTHLPVSHGPTVNGPDLIPADDAHPTWVGCHSLFVVYFHKIKSFSFEDCCRIFNNKIYEEM